MVIVNWKYANNIQIRILRYFLLPGIGLAFARIMNTF